MYFVKRYTNSLNSLLRKPRKHFFKARKNNLFAQALGIKS